MPSHILFGDITATTISYLNDRLPTHGETVAVRNRVPSSRPTRFVTVQRTGGPAVSPVSENAQVTVDAWGVSAEDAHDLAQLVRALILAMPDSPDLDAPVYRASEFGGPAWLPDPDSTQPRYRWSVQLHVRGEGFTP